MRPKYWVCFASQTLAGIVLLLVGIPQYRHLMSHDVVEVKPFPFWMLAILVLAQPAYWMGRKIRPELDNISPAGVFMGHVLLFWGRLIFLFVTCVFAAVFYMQREIQFEFARLVLLISVIFSMFCYSLELEYLAGKLNRNR